MKRQPTIYSQNVAGSFCRIGSKPKRRIKAFPLAIAAIYIAALLVGVVAYKLYRSYMAYASYTANAISTPSLANVDDLAMDGAGGGRP